MSRPSSKRVKRNEDDKWRNFRHRSKQLKEGTERLYAGELDQLIPVSVNLRVLVDESKKGNGILFKYASDYNVEPTVKRKVIAGDSKPELSLREFLAETAYIGRPSHQISNIELIKKLADQTGAHEDDSLEADLAQAMGGNMIIGGLPAHIRSFAGIASGSFKVVISC